MLGIGSVEASDKKFLWLGRKNEKLGCYIFPKFLSNTSLLLTDAIIIRRLRYEKVFAAKLFGIGWLLVRWGCRI